MDHRIPIKINVNSPPQSSASLSSGGRLDTHSPHSSGGDIRDKMQQRMREFEDESRRWREQFMSTGMDNHRPRMFVNFPDFPDWSSPSASLGRSGSGLFNGGVVSASNTSSSSAVQNSHKSFIEEDNDGNKKYKLQFDIGDFKPQEVQVRTEGRLLIIKGEREVHAGSASESKQFNREITLPDFIEPTTVTSYLCDGILTVDAPVLMDRFAITGGGSNTSTLNSIQSSRRSPFRDQISPSRGGLLTTVVNTSHSPSLSTHTAQHQRQQQQEQTAVGTVGPNSTSTYKFNLSEFRPEDISITVTDTTLKIHAIREEMEPRGKTYREFKRELGLPANADVKRLKNSLQADGTLYIEVPVIEQPVRQVAAAAQPVQSLNKQFNQLQLDQQQNVNERVNIDDKELKITFDLTGYKPDDVIIKCMSNTLKVHAIHIDNSKGNQIHREYSRSYVLPEWVNGELLRARMSENGTLTVEVPLPQVAQPAQLERLIKIQQI